MEGCVGEGALEIRQGGRRKQGRSLQALLRMDYAEGSPRSVQGLT